MPRKEPPSAGESRTVVTLSEAETFRLAEELASGFSGTEVVLLEGELGAGKTVFAKGLASGAGVGNVDEVRSPSFTLVNIHEGRRTVFHIDLYRLERAADILDLGWEDYLGAGIVIVEWADRLVFPLEGISVRIEAGTGDERRITIRRP
ncbi:MAG TPA: tRNA (adenosine(37)-N6)-threonylcarbamoyltransferase complex ATPase subunit type 1 TsaE [Terriglobales bacterium]|nr:tRNA (adenosine(37)-N6)-threonylcarbamoyltransferase complex ATPase subunit type 1 TsaE [Terriglobales bacterium]